MTPRLAMRPRAPADGGGNDGAGRAVLDGGWWPRSANPALELPGLVLALQARGPADDHRLIVHIMLEAAGWDVHPRRLRVDGPDDIREVQLSWFDHLPAGRLTAIYADGRHVDLFTLPASTPYAEAQDALGTAAR
ncbi:DUF5994 family protein [Actinomadura livida]|nr:MULTISPECIES: DUF5994 family protein [Actinomadura]MBB4772043.1 hypothetical protein [Actinomadura catellatispora]